MLVASGVEFGDARMAALGQLPQVIGNIQTAIGCGTIRRASGIAIQVMVGDPVCQGDVIETAADGRIEIRFVDGTVFNLSRDACVELSEFARDANGTLRSALFAVTRGTFAFVAGQLARTGCLTVDTPVGAIRSSGQAVGIGMLSFAALIFSLMKEVQAADPNVTFLDDDTITYKDLEHGVFELITKEAIPRHIIVEDPGETVVLSRKGSSVSVNEVANSPTRMQELQAAQQDVLANFAKGLGPNGSSTPPFVNPLPVEPINFIQTDAPHAQNSLPPIQLMIFTVPEIIIPPPQPPTLNLGAGPTEIDTAVFDTFTATGGTFSASSVNGAPLTFGIGGGVAGNTVLGGGDIRCIEHRPVWHALRRQHDRRLHLGPEQRRDQCAAGADDRKLHDHGIGRHALSQSGLHDQHQRRQRRGRHFRHRDRRGGRGGRRRQCLARPADRDGHTHRHRRRQSGQHLYAS